MKYEVLAGNRVRKMPEWIVKTSSYQGESESSFNTELEAQKKFHEWVKYNGQLQVKVWEPVKKANGEEYPISGNHNWKEGQLIEEGKDFKIGYDFSEIDQQQAQELGNEKENYKVAIPSQLINKSK